MTSTLHYIYLHGFASGPQSYKAQYLSDRAQALGVSFHLPDLNHPDFAHLTLSRQLQHVRSLMASLTGPVTLIGSSFGGLTAAWLGETCPTVERLVLLAPAFGFMQHWLPKLGADQVRRWQQTDALAVYHYGLKRTMALQYGFVADMQQYEEEALRRSLPTLILHGVHDEVIPVDASRQFAAPRPWVDLIELDSDHGLATVMPDIWQAIQRFCQISGGDRSAPEDSIVP